MEKCCPSMPACCDMRGMLQFLILWLLTKKPMYGEEIARGIEEVRGEKPTPGTIYPALKQLVKKGSVKSEKKGRLVIYSLTEEGRLGIEEAVEYFCAVFGRIFLEYQKLRLPSKRPR